MPSTSAQIATDSWISSLKAVLVRLVSNGSCQFGNFEILRPNWDAVNIASCLTLKTTMPRQLIVSTYSLTIDFRSWSLSRTIRASRETSDPSSILQRSNGTFLWAALVIEELKNLETYEDEREVLQFLHKMPSGLPELYDRMIAQIKQLASNMDRGRCLRILSTMATTYRPLTLTALPILADLKGNLARPETLRKLIQMCGSFFTIQNQTIYFIHQSAKDYLVQRGNQIIHYDIYSRSVGALKSQGGLRTNIYALTYPGAKTEEISPPHPNPLEHIQYCCVYWLQHFWDSVEASRTPETGAIEDVYTFLQQHLLHWFEALSLLKSLQTGILL